MPIVAIDLDGREPEVVTGGINTLVIVINGYEGNDPPKWKTQTKNNPFATGEYDDLSVLSELEGKVPALKVLQYSSDNSEDTKTDIKVTIDEYVKNNPHGKVVIIGHSRGADNAVELVNENPAIKVDYLITLDISDGTEWNDDNIPSNVSSAINFYNPEASGQLGGTEVEKAPGNTSSTVMNIPVYETSHTEIDNKISEGISNMVSKIATDNNIQVSPTKKK